jgi:Mg-chelatase subunit ChlD
MDMAHTLGEDKGPRLAFRTWSLSGKGDALEREAAIAGEAHQSSALDRERFSDQFLTTPAPAPPVLMAAKSSVTPIVLPGAISGETTTQPNAKQRELSRVNGGVFGPEGKPLATPPDKSAFVARYAYTVPPPAPDSGVRAGIPAVSPESSSVHNAAPEDISGALQDLFQRSNARQQNNDQIAMLGQSNPLYKRETGNGQPAPGGTIAGLGGTGGGFGGTQRQYPNNTTTGDATFSLDPEARRVVGAAADGRQKEVAASDSFFSQPQTVGALEAGRTVKNEGQIQALGQPSPRAMLAAHSAAVLGTDSGALPGSGSVAADGPTINLGQGFAYTKGAGGPENAWVRNFTVGAEGAIPATPPASPQEVAVSQQAAKEPESRVTLQGITTLAGAKTMFLGAVTNYFATATAGDTEAKRPETFHFYSDLNRQLNFDTNGGQGPVLADVPVAGSFYRRRGDEVGPGGTVKAEEKVNSLELAYQTEGGQMRASESERGDQRVASNVYSLNVVGYNNVPATATNVITLDDTEAVRRYPSSVALPTSPGETSATLKDSSVVEQKSRQLADAKRNLEELQRFRQILDTKIASERIDVDLPKTAMVEIVDKAAAQPTQSPSLGDRIQSALGGKVGRSARIKVERDQSDVTGFAERGQTATYDPYFIQSEFERMQSEAVLGKVIDELDLKKAWGDKQGGGTLTKEEALGRLKKSLDLRPVPNTSLIDVGVKSDSPEEAARIANAVAEAYRDQRLEQRKELSQGSIKALEARFAAQEQKVASAKQEVERLQEAPKAPSTAQSDAGPPKPAAPAPIPQPEIQTSDNAFSTFSLNVSDVSFKLTAASLEKGVMPEPANVRSEEFINAFDYRDPEPPPGVAVGFAWERAQYPFAQNRDLLRFSIKTAAQGRQPGRPMNIVLLLDTSGSMERADRVQIIREALRVLAGELQPQDKLSIVTFARTARLWADGVPGNQAAQVVEEVSDITPQGGTNLEDAMNLAYATALRHYLANGINRVVLLTDGAANLGDVEPETLKQKVEANRKQGIALDCFGIGWEGYNDDLLEVLSRNGDGRYGFINTPEEAATEFAAQLAGALHVAASDVKAQIEFNPARVTAYRQIGYAKHQLTKEQFRDNTVVAAQIGAAESGNALYVIAVNPAGDGPLATVRVRYRVPGTSDVHEHEWSVPYTRNTVPLDQSSPAMRLAATASAFSEWLAASPYAAEVTPDRLLGYLSGVPEVYGADARPKKLEWMLRQAKSIAGK